MSAFRRFGQGAAVVGVLVGIVVGLPLLLWSLIGWPLPHAVPSWGDVSATLQQNGVSDSALLDAIAVVCWMLWLTFTISLVFEVIAAAQGRVVRRLALASPMQILAATLVSTLVMSFASNAKSAPVIPIDSYVVTMQPAALVLPTDVPETQAVATNAETQAPSISYTVVRHDTLWGISERHLGDPTRWKEIYALNKDKPQSDGRSLVDADMIRPGWILQLPSDASGLSPQVAPVVVAPPTVVETAPAPQVEPESTATTNATVDVTTSTTSIEAHATESAVPRTNVATHGVSLASSAIIPASLVAGIGSALLTVRLRRRVRRSLDDPAPGISWSEPLVDEAVREVRRRDLESELSSLGFEDASDDVVAPDQPQSLSVVDVTEIIARSLSEVRSIVVDAIANTNCEVVIVGAPLSDALIRGSQSFVGLQVVDAAESFSLVDAAIVARARVLQEADLLDIASYRESFPGEPMPTKLFVFDGLNSDDITRLQECADRSRNLDVKLLLAEDSSETLDLRDGDGQNYTMSVVEARSMVDLVRASRVEHKENVEVSTEAFIAPIEDADSLRPIEVSVFGPVRIVARGEEIKSGLRGKARELLAFLALRPQGATWDVIGAALWPEANGKQANERFRTTLGNLRTTLRNSTSSDAKFVDLIDERYVLDATLFDCDVWRFQSALTEAASDSADVKAALQRAAGSYGGELAESSYYEWAEAPREDLRRRILDALGRLSELQQRDGNATAALSTLERAIALDPYVEEVYQRVMVLQAEAGHPDAVVRTYRLLERRLNEIDAEPTERTMALLRSAAA